MEQDSNLNHNDVSSAVSLIRTAILQSQARAAKAVNQEQLALYFGIGRFISANTRSKNWGRGVIEGISQQLRLELPGLRGFGVSSLKNMRVFYEAWSNLETNSAIAIGKTDSNSPIAIGELDKTVDIEAHTIRQLQLTNLENFPLTEFLSISFTHHIPSTLGVATYKTADEVEPDLIRFLPPKEELAKLLEEEE